PRTAVLDSQVDRQCLVNLTQVVTAEDCSSDPSAGRQHTDPARYRVGHRSPLCGDGRSVIWRWRLLHLVLLAAHRLADGFLGLLRSEEHTSELQSRENLVCRLLLEKKN